MIKVFLFALVLLMVTGCQNITPQPKKEKQEKALETQQKKTITKKNNDITKKRTTKQKKVVQKTPKKVKATTLFQTVKKEDAVLIQKGADKEHCAICGMNLVKYYKTNHAAKLEGQNIQYCSMHCLTKHINEGAELENPMVVDVTSLKFIPVTEAFYVVGSDVPGTMSKTSKYAFQSLKDAKNFQKVHGGEILDFYSTWQIAKKDFKN